MKCSRAKLITEYRLPYIERIKPDLGKPSHMFSSPLPACFPAGVAGAHWEPLAREAAPVMGSSPTQKSPQA